MEHKTFITIELNDFEFNQQDEMSLRKALIKKLKENLLIIKDVTNVNITEGKGKGKNNAVIKTITSVKTYL